MEKIIKLYAPIFSNEVSTNAHTLHRALSMLGYAVEQGERIRQQAGKSTQQSVRDLQQKMKVPTNKKVLVDESTAELINRLVAEKGRLQKEVLFRVAGRTVAQDGSPVAGQRLSAFRIDVQGAGLVKTVQSVGALKKESGFVFVEATESNRSGVYAIKFPWEPIRHSKRKRADIVVFATDGDAITGRSRIISTSDYEDTIDARNVDLIVVQQKTAPTEYEALMSALVAVLQENKLTLQDLFDADEQIAFIASEIEMDASRIQIAVEAERINAGQKQKLAHDLLYGLGRQEISLNWPALYRKKTHHLAAAIERAIYTKIIPAHTQQAIDQFLAEVHQRATRFILDYKGNGQDKSVDTILSYALPDKKQRAAFVAAARQYRGKPECFWKEYLPIDPAFKNDPGLIKKIQLTNQLALLTQNHYPLVEELQVKKKIKTVAQLLEWTAGEWTAVLKKTGIPKHITGARESEKAERYAAQMRNTLHAAYPTQKVAMMAKNKELHIKDANIAEGIQDFLSGNPAFHIGRSRVHDFDQDIRKAAPQYHEKVKDELLRMQRMFNLSPSPSVMGRLMGLGFYSANTIAGIPAKNFMNKFGEDLGGGGIAAGVHQRAAFISARGEYLLNAMRDISHGANPELAFSRHDQEAATAILNNHIANYSNLFGSPDICECEHCRSVYSPAAYFVDLMQFLWRSMPQNGVKSALDVFEERRPDLFHMPLTCENTNTVIPYIDLANEVMEFYTAHDELNNRAAYDTGDATSEELRANPQHVNIEAYKILAAVQPEAVKPAVYPFNLPYHRPLDAIRICSRQLQTSRFELMQAFRNVDTPEEVQAIEAESLDISPEEYRIFTGADFADNQDQTPLHNYFGYSDAAELEDMAAVPEFLRRSGIQYTELVELVKTRFINPYQDNLDFLQNVFKNSDLDPAIIYNYLERIEAGIITDDERLEIERTIINYRPDFDYSDLAGWVLRDDEEGRNNWDKFNAVITLYQPESLCELDTTLLRTVRNVYTDASVSGIDSGTWSKIHRFIRLRRKLGWSIHELDLVLIALGEQDITPQTISKLSAFVLLKQQTNLLADQLAVFWGEIDTYGPKSLYKRLFLNKSVHSAGKVSGADKFGNYLANNETISRNIPGICAAFRISEQELNVILTNASTISETLNLQNLSIIHRYVVLSRALKIPVKDICVLIQLFNAAPFSTWLPEPEIFTDISPAATLEFFNLAKAIKDSGFKPEMLQYILQGDVPAESTLGLDPNKTRQTVRAIREALRAIEQEYPAEPAPPFTADMLRNKLLFTFDAAVVSEMAGILDESVSYFTLAASNLDINIPDELSKKYSYAKSSGRLNCRGVMAEAEREALQALDGGSIEEAVAVLYAMPEDFIRNNFNGVFGERTEDDIAFLLNRPAQDPPATPEEKSRYVYGFYLPLLKQKLREDALVKNIAPLIGLSEPSTSLLIKADISWLLENLPQGGHSGSYFNLDAPDTILLSRIDPEINFSWSEGAPEPIVSADNFGVRWESYLLPPSSDDYTFMVSVAEADESFDLYLDDILLGAKPAGDQRLSLEFSAGSLQGGKIYRLRLEYHESVRQAGIQLFWQRPATAREIVPMESAYPTGVMHQFMEDYAKKYHRAAQFITGFALSEQEVKHFLTYNTDFDGIDFHTLLPVHWKRIHSYTRLRNAIPQAQATLIDLFAAANKIAPNPEAADIQFQSILTLLYQATAWDATNLQYLIRDHFELASSDYFKNEVKLNALLDAMRLISHTGMSAQTLAAWAAPETSYNHLNEIAQQAQKAVKAKYEEKDWLQIARNMSDTLRGHQQQALISHLLTKPELQEWGVYDADGLFEYFLIDVQMGACMDTSRIVQANASIQLFVARCLLNKEPDVSPDAIDAARWEWMKNYRLWEANRKVLLYPENWLDPEWRDNKSEFFKELESELVQNDIADRTVETALRNYLSKMNEVANLDVCGMYQDQDTQTVHVFARTHHVPYQYFYRTCDQYWKWSAWEKVPIDIRGVEDGDNSGVHLIPVVWKKRLILFWPEFMEKSTSNLPPRSYQDQAEETISHDEPEKYWEIRLAWSEYVDRRWEPKQVTNDFIYSWFSQKPKTYRFFPTLRDINGTQQILKIEYVDTSLLLGGSFNLVDINSKIQFKNFDLYPSIDKRWLFNSHFMKKNDYTARLIFNEKIYLKNPVEHKIQFTDWSTDVDFVASLSLPFFYHDINRTYFVKQVTNNILDQIVAPDGQDPIIGIGEFELGSPENPVFNEGYAIPENAGNGFAPFGGAPAYGALKVIQQHSPRGEMINSQHLEMPFANSAQFAGQGLEFHTFYHPYSDKFSSNLNQNGLNGLMNCDLFVKEENGNKSIPDDHGDTFRDAYIPSFDDGLVRHLSLYPSDRTLYKENVCFDMYGANSIYNWELFFHAPLYIATRLSKNGKYAEAMRWFHYIFDPTTDESPQNGHEMARFWKVLPFRKAQEEGPEQIEKWLRQLEPNADRSKENNVIEEWRNNPFRPHLVAGNRPTAYMRYVVLKYVENLIAWGDQLFRKDTMESINEALQIYVIANHILGPRPQFVPKRGEIKAETYTSLKPKLDDFSNALVQMENIFPYSSEIPLAAGDYGGNMLGFATAFYFCIPSNDKLLGYWDTVADRLFKIRHCMNIEGVERRLALFEPPIDPGMLIKAAAQGLSLGEILSDLSSPPPIYRFTYLLQKAAEFCAEVKSLGAALLSALEKKDGEVLALMRATQETTMLGMITAIKDRQVLEAKANKENLLKTRETSVFRLQYYLDLLGNEDVTVPAVPSIEADLNAASQLPADTIIPEIETDVDETLVDSDETGVKIIKKEKEDFDKSNLAKWFQSGAGAGEALAGIFHLFPNVEAEATPLGVGVGAWYGGQNLGAGTSALAKVSQLIGQHLSMEAAEAAKMASYIRREQDWTLQANLAAKEIIQIDKQIVAADIRRQSAEKELENHHQQIAHAQEVEDFLKGNTVKGSTDRKFSTKENYQWMSEQLFGVYKQSYNMAFDLAKKAEIAYRQETGDQNASFVQYGYWDNNYQGLMAGEQLHFALRQMEKAFMEENKRELELTKHISLATWNPLALLDLKETGRCYLSVPEEWFDLDFQGHYFRRIKSVRMSIPCVIGPYTSVNCTLRLLKNTIRINTAPNTGYAQNMEEDDSRFRSNHIQVKSIATSSGQNDSGMFELNFRDERYLPFEGAGAISEWMIEMTGDPNLRQFDYSTISDIILHLSYTAREEGGRFKEDATSHLNSFLSDAAAQPLMRLFNLRQEFPEKWHQMNNENPLEVILDKSTFPYLAQVGEPIIQNLTLITDGNITQISKGEIELESNNSEDIGNFHSFEFSGASIGQSFTITFENAASVKDAYLLVRYTI
jgi:hypothetical protein